MPNQTSTNTDGGQSSDPEHDFVPGIRSGVTSVLHRTQIAFGTTSAPYGVNPLSPDLFPSHQSDHYPSSPYYQSFAQNGVQSAPYTSPQQGNFGAWIGPDFPEAQAPSPSFNIDLNTAAGNTHPHQFSAAVPFGFNYDPSNVGLQPGVLSGHSNSYVPSFSSRPGYPSSVTTGHEDRSFYAPSRVSHAETTDLATELPDSTRRFKCPLCQRPFTSKKDLERHENAKFHKTGYGSSGTSDSDYTCCCSYKNNRKDNYKRHLKTVRNIYFSIINNYMGGHHLPSYCPVIP